MVLNGVIYCNLIRDSVWDVSIKSRKVHWNGKNSLQAQSLQRGKNLCTISGSVFSNSAEISSEWCCWTSVVWCKRFGQAAVQSRMGCPVKPEAVIDLYVQKSETYFGHVTKKENVAPVPVALSDIRNDLKSDIIFIHHPMRSHWRDLSRAVPRCWIQGTHRKSPRILRYNPADIDSSGLNMISTGLTAKIKHVWLDLSSSCQLLAWCCCCCWWGSSAQSWRGERAGERERAHRKQAKEGAEADQSPAENQDGGWTEPGVCVALVVILQQLKGTSGSPKPARKWCSNSSVSSGCSSAAAKVRMRGSLELDDFVDKLSAFMPWWSAAGRESWGREGWIV